MRSAAFEREEEDDCACHPILSPPYEYIKVFYFFFLFFFKHPPTPSRVPTVVDAISNFDCAPYRNVQAVTALIFGPVKNSVYVC